MVSFCDDRDGFENEKDSVGDLEVWMWHRIVEVSIVPILVA